jgi:anti-sigma factor RsiW
MAKIIPIDSDIHRYTQEALPWYVTGRLGADERAKIDQHLVACAKCRRDLEAERELATQIVTLPLDVDAGWAAVRRRIHGPGERKRPPSPLRAFKDLFVQPTRVGWVLAAQLLVIAATGTAYYALPRQPAAEYHALSDTAAHGAGNIIAMFRPEASEQQVRSMLLAQNARIVDGPTASGAYILMVPDDRRAEALVQLQKSKAIALAQPIDAEPVR